MPRLYTLKFEAVALGAPADLGVVPGITGKSVRILRIHLSPALDTSLPGAQGYKLRCRILPATVTIGSAGSGGATGITPSKKDLGDAACSITNAATYLTTPSSTNGTAVVVFDGGCHIYQGIDKRFDSPIPVFSTSAFTFELLSSPSGTCTHSMTIDLEEAG